MLLSHYSNSHDHYISANNYVCKQDKEVAHHHQHPPNLAEVALRKTYRTIAANRMGGKRRKSGKQGKEREVDQMAWSCFPIIQR